LSKCMENNFMINHQSASLIFLSDGYHFWKIAKRWRWLVAAKYAQSIAPLAIQMAPIMAKTRKDAVCVQCISTGMEPTVLVAPQDWEASPKTEH